MSGNSRCEAERGRRYHDRRKQQEDHDFRNMTTAFLVPDASMSSFSD
jgi:hypothetical protein